MTLALRYAVRSDVGLLREGNEDSAYAGPRLLAVADGMGGHAAGEVASAVAITALADLDEDLPASQLLDALAAAVTRANRTLHEMVTANPSIGGMGTTLTAMLWSGTRAALCHIGDSRAYVLSDGELHQITHDHTLVQSLVDDGRITADEAATHPQRSLLLRALDGTSEAEPDLTLREMTVGDRYLLCSDGLSSVVSEETLRQTLASVADPSDTVLHLIELAIRGGGPDNITCIVADVVDSARRPPSRPVLAGAATNGSAPPPPPMRTNSPAGRAHVLTRTAPQPAITLDHDDEAPRQPAEEPDEPHRGRRRWPVVTSLLSLLAIVVLAGGYLGWRYTQDQYYVGISKGNVAIFQGVNQTLFGVRLSHVFDRSDIPVAQTPDQQSVQGTILAASLAGARKTVTSIYNDWQGCLSADHAWNTYDQQQKTYGSEASAYKKAHGSLKPVVVKGKHYKPPTPPVPPKQQIPSSCPSNAPASQGTITPPSGTPSASPGATSGASVAPAPNSSSTHHRSAGKR